MPLSLRLMGQWQPPPWHALSPEGASFRLSTVARPQEPCHRAKEWAQIVFKGDCWFCTRAPVSLPLAAQGAPCQHQHANRMLGGASSALGSFVGCRAPAVRAGA